MWKLKDKEIIAFFSLWKIGLENQKAILIFST